MQLFKGHKIRGLATQLGVREWVSRLLAGASCQKLRILSGRSVAIQIGLCRFFCSIKLAQRLWNAQTGQESLTIKAVTSDAGSLVFSPDGKLLASADRAVVRIWDAGTGEQLLTFQGHTSEIDSIVFSPDGNRVASGASRNNTVKVWDAHTGEELLSLKKSSGESNSLAFSPDGHHLASNGDNGVTIWDATPLPE
jgi:WD40 repeat protein